MDAADGLAYYLAEWYLPEITETSVDEMVAKLDAAAAIVSSESTQVRLVVTLAVPTAKCSTESSAHTHPRTSPTAGSSSTMTCPR